jgi:hypothetical protein
VRASALRAPGRPTARLRRHYLDTLDLKGQRFTAVGYGTVREDKRTGPNALFFDGKRRFATQGFHSLTASWLNLSMNPLHR